MSLEDELLNLEVENVFDIIYEIGHKCEAMIPLSYVKGVSISNYELSAIPKSYVKRLIGHIFFDENNSDDVVLDIDSSRKEIIQNLELFRKYGREKIIKLNKEKEIIERVINYHNSKIDISDSRNEEKNEFVNYFKNISDSLLDYIGKMNDLDSNAEEEIHRLKIASTDLVRISKRILDFAKKSIEISEKREFDYVA